MIDLSRLKPNDFGRVGVFLGGRSHERSISLKSGEAIFQALRNAGLDAVKIDTANGLRSQLKEHSIDLAFLALHGTGGEDGAVQKVLNKARIPYVGSDPHASALAFDKARAKRVFIRHGIPTPSYDVLTRATWRKKLQKWVPPYVIKPVNEGSSIGVFFIHKRENISKQIQANFRNYPRLLVEKKIVGREFTVGIFGDQALPVIELRPKRKFYDFKAKYTKGLTEYLVPAPIPDNLANNLRSLALQVHNVLGLRDLSRVDFKVDNKNQPFVLEVNSIPGFTEMSLLPKAAQCVGIGFVELCLSLLEMARTREEVKV